MHDEPLGVGHMLVIAGTSTLAAVGAAAIPSAVCIYILYTHRETHTDTHTHTHTHTHTYVYTYVMSSSHL